MNNKQSLILICQYLIETLDVSNDKHYSLACVELGLHKHRFTINCMAKAYDIT